MLVAHLHLAVRPDSSIERRHAHTRDKLARAIFRFGGCLDSAAQPDIGTIPRRNPDAPVLPGVDVEDVGSREDRFAYLTVVQPATVVTQAFGAQVIGGIRRLRRLAIQARSGHSRGQRQ
jgi:hypothetical protein